MKFFVASDIHGSACGCRRMLEAFERSGAERMLLLGDLLYHGPRNDLPEEYRPKEVIAMLNRCKDQIYAVRGNCEAEVDQMVLEFPVMADYCLVILGKKRVFATHGHLFHENHLPPLGGGDILLHGHTHIWEAKRTDRCYILNPGSVSLPKRGREATYAMLTEDCFDIRNFRDETVCSLPLEEMT